MSNSRHLSIVAMLAVVACSSDEPRSDTASASGSVAAAPLAAQGRDSIDLKKYRLTMDKVDRTLVAQRNMALKMKGMSEAERERIEQDLGSEDDSMEQMAAKIASNARMNAAIKEAGLTAQEYVAVTMAMIQAGLASAIVDMRPKDNLDSLAREMETNPDNIRFFRANKVELERKQKALEAELKKLGVS